MGILNIKRVLFVFGVLVVGFVGLRIYTAFGNERRAALFRAKEADERTAREQEVFDRDKAELDCDHAWGFYRIAQREAEYVRVTRGESAYRAAEAEADEFKPLCDSEFSLDMSTRITGDSLDHDSAASLSRALAVSERKYAADRKTQAARIWHKIWASVAGATPERSEEWVKFLAQKYDGMLGNLVLGTPLDAASAAEVQQRIQKTLEETRQAPEKFKRKIEEIHQRIEKAAAGKR
jgi:hypothetical protein